MHIYVSRILHRIVDGILTMRYKLISELCPVFSGNEEMVAMAGK